MSKKPKIEMLKVTEIMAHPKNPRVHPDELLQKLERSIREFGWTNPVLVSKDGILLAGHARVKAAERLGIEEIPAVRLPLTGEKADAYLIADNRLQDDSTWDEKVLAGLLGELSDLDLTVTGFTAAELAEIVAANYEPDEENLDDYPLDDKVAEIKDREPRSRTGDIYLLGRHRLMCGDSTYAGDLAKLCDGRLVDLVVVDPPYNVDYEGGTGDKLKIQNDNMNESFFREFLHSAYSRLLEVSKPGAPIYVFSPSSNPDFIVQLEAAGWTFKQSIMWLKNAFVLGRSDFHYIHEQIIYGHKPGAVRPWYGRRKYSSLFFGRDSGLEILPNGGGSFTVNVVNETLLASLRVPSYDVEFLLDTDEATVWRARKPTVNREHPTMKPIELIKKALRLSSLEDGIVMDTFGGSGTTLLACEVMQRTCFMMEIDPVYIDVIVDRWESLTGKKAVKISGGD